MTKLLMMRSFDRLVHRDADDHVGCHHWLGPLNTDGSGRFCWRGRRFRAHRLIYGWAHGVTPGGHVVRPICGDRLCVNVEHLGAFPPQENLTGGNLAHLRAHIDGCPTDGPVDAFTFLNRSRGGRGLLDQCSASEPAAGHKVTGGRA